MKRFLVGIVLIMIGLCAATVSRAQSSYIDLTLVSAKDYNQPLANFSHDVFENAFRISTDRGAVWQEDINDALMVFLGLLEPGVSYIIQHEPTYYFVFQYNAAKDSYLVMNNSIGEKNEAIYVDTMEEALSEMLKLLQIFYSNTSVFNLKEYSAY